MMVFVKVIVAFKSGLDIVLHLLRFNSCKPKRIIYYTKMFDQVLLYKIDGIRRACNCWEATWAYFIKLIEGTWKSKIPISESQEANQEEQNNNRPINLMDDNCLTMRTLKPSKVFLRYLFVVKFNLNSKFVTTWVRVIKYK